MRILLLTMQFSNNQLARAHSLWLVARHLGHTVEVVTVEPGEIWRPLSANPDFAASCTVLSGPDALRERIRTRADLVLSIKPLPVSLGLGHRLTRELGVPLLCDIDDPDIEALTIWAGRTRLRTARRLLMATPKMPQHVRMTRLARATPSIVSNPVLQQRYGGEVVPHGRPDQGAGAAHTREQPVIGLVGTVWGHKGLDLLRGAAAQLAPQGWRLRVTADAPADAAPWEDWLGSQIFGAAAAEVMRTSDVVALPSENHGFGPGQLPMKLMDAMLAGRAVAVSRVGPMPWAVGDAGRVFAPGSVPALVDALRPLRDPGLRADLGRRARELALQRYTVPAVAPALQRALHRAVAAAAVPSR